MASQASEVHKRKIGITLFDCPRDMCWVAAALQGGCGLGWRLATREAAGLSFGDGSPGIG
jgi:hypothetical protein